MTMNLNKINKNLFFEHTKTNIIKQLEAPDQRIIYLSQILNKLPQTINELYEQLRIITDRKYPMLDSFVSIKEYCLFINKEDKSIIENIKENKLKIKTIIENDIGISFSPGEEIIIKNISQNILDIINTKDQIINIIEELFEKHFKNFKKIATTTLACKMLEITGSFKRLATMPSSTIQLLGSEKTFFLALRKNKKTPKYGVLYNHPLMIPLSNRNKGRFARTLASKIVIAIKADINNIYLADDIYLNLENKLKKYK
jgi:nucleolar protein 56